MSFRRAARRVVRPRRATLSARQLELIERDRRSALRTAAFGDC